MNGLVKWCAIALIAVACMTLCGGCFMTHYAVSDGYRDGYVQKVSTKTGIGVFWTTEGELALPGFGGTNQGKSGNTRLGNVWAFSVTDDNVTKQLKEFNGDELVRLYYKERPFTLPWEGDTGYFVYKVERRERK